MARRVENRRASPGSYRFAPKGELVKITESQGMRVRGESSRRNCQGGGPDLGLRASSADRLDRPVGYEPSGFRRPEARPSPPPRVPDRDDPVARGAAPLVTPVVRVGLTRRPAVGRVRVEGSARGERLPPRELPRAPDLDDQSRIEPKSREGKDRRPPIAGNPLSSLPLRRTASRGTDLISGSLTGLRYASAIQYGSGVLNPLGAWDTPSLRALCSSPSVGSRTGGELGISGGVGSVGSPTGSSPPAWPSAIARAPSRASTWLDRLHNPLSKSWVSQCVAHWGLGPAG